VPDGLRGPNPLAAYLHFLVPELGTAPARSDPPTILEAERWGFERIAADRPTLVFLDDLHVADEATIDLLHAAAAWLEGLPLLVVGAHRSDELPPDHPLRRLRLERRRAARAHEVVVGPLDLEGTARLAARIFDRALSPALQALLHERTQGLPFFVEERAAALAASGRLRATAVGLALDQADPLPIPESVGDTVLLRCQGLSETAGAALQVAAVAGLRFPLDLAADLAGDDAVLDALLERQLLVESEPGVGTFRHALVREAVYGDIPWGRRRALHRLVLTARWRKPRSRSPTFTPATALQHSQPHDSQAGPPSPNTAVSSEGRPNRQVGISDPTSDVPGNTIANPNPTLVSTAS